MSQTPQLDHQSAAASPMSKSVMQASLRCNCIKRSVRLAIILATALVSNWVAAAASASAQMPSQGTADGPDGKRYGFDCSYPVFSTDLSKCAQDLGDKAKFYKEYMDGCRKVHGEICDENEVERLEDNARQPMSIRNFTETGYLKTRAPSEVVELVNMFWEKNKDRRHEEERNMGDIYTNNWESPTEMVSIDNDDLEGGGYTLQKAVAEAAQRTIEAWTGMKQQMFGVYGVRVYNEGAVLIPHCDTLPRISSAIVNVAQDVDEAWPLEVYGRDGLAVNITMEPGEMILYESATVVHGRPFPLKGRYYANIFIHFEPISFVDGRPFVNIEDPDLPPYIIAGSPEGQYQREEYLDSRQDHNCSETQVHAAVCDGDMDALRRFAKDDIESLYEFDKDGWEPIHEAARMGRTDIVEFLIQHDADVNSQHDFGRGLSPLSIAIKYNGVNHEIVEYLQSVGAEGRWWEPNDDSYDLEDEEYQDEYVYGYDYEYVYYDEDGTDDDGEEHDSSAGSDDMNDEL